MKTMNAIQNFLEAKQADGTDPKTLKWYRAMLKPLSDNYGNVNVGQISTPDMRELMIALRSKTASKATISGYSVALRAFWAWVERETGKVNPMGGIKKPGRPTPHPRAISPADLKAIYQACGGGWIGARDRAIILMLADTGIRAGGLLTLKIDDLDLTKRRAIVKEKFGKKRPVPYTRLTMSVLKTYLMARPKHGVALFCTSKGDPLTYWGLRQLLMRLAKRAGIKGRYNIHSFRHFAAREYLRQGGDLATLATLLGHADVSTTAAHYAVYDSDEIAARHDLHSPLKTVFGRSSSADAD
ncbi:MAG TPA: tyrosine-type recombinase/integrase [Aggregatilineales bacterium]|nr:tyrosine-type recombinase/integrase [Anaerolineales bacterium]HRE48333.1 tyrosine-type recombinase/integrase [Aggregatilineales bacterium]